MHSQTDKPATRSPSFHLFAKLPAELQLQIWREAASPGPAMHVFDLCFPSSYSLSEGDRGARAFGTLWRYMELEDVAFLDARESNGESFLTRHDPMRYRTSGGERQGAISDPSMYRWRMALRRTCVDASGAAALPSDPDKIKTVTLPGANKYVQYDNSVDVLYLRLAQDAPLSSTSPSTAQLGSVTQGKAVQGVEALPARKLSTLINGLIDHPWSRDMASTIQSARRIALDLTSPSPSDPFAEANNEPLMHIDSAAFLACSLHHNLEHLYLVVSSKPEDGFRVRDLQTRGALFQSLASSKESGLAAVERDADVINGVGVTYREVFDFEGLGWHTTSALYELAKMMDEAVGSMQRESLEPNLVFKGVRVLLEEKDP